MKSIVSATALACALIWPAVHSTAALAQPQPGPDTVYFGVYSPDVDPTSEQFDTEDDPQFSGEPTTMVDPLMAQLLGDLIKRLKLQLHLTSVVVTHDMRLAKKLADRVVFLHEAKVIFFGSPAEMERSPEPIVREFLALDELRLDPPPPPPQPGEDLGGRR